MRLRHCVSNTSNLHAEGVHLSVVGNPSGLEVLQLNLMGWAENRQRIESRRLEVGLNLLYYLSLVLVLLVSLVRD